MSSDHRYPNQSLRLKIVWPALQNPADSCGPGCGNNTSIRRLKAMGSRQRNLLDSALNKSWGNLGSLCSLL